MKKDEKRFKEAGRKFALPFYVMKLTLRVSPAYLTATAGMSFVKLFGAVFVSLFGCALRFR